MKQTSGLFDSVWTTGIKWFVALLVVGTWAGAVSAGVVYRWVPDPVQPPWNNPWEPDRSTLYIEFDPSYYRSGHSAGGNYVCPDGSPSCGWLLPWQTPIPVNGVLRVSWAPIITLEPEPCLETGQPYCSVLPDANELVLTRASHYWSGVIAMSWNFDLGSELAGDMYIDHDIAEANPAYYRNGTLKLSYNITTWRENGKFVLDTSTVVPEPGTVALLGLGLVGLAFTRRRKQ